MQVNIEFTDTFMGISFGIIAYLGMWFWTWILFGFWPYWWAFPAFITGTSQIIGCIVLAIYYFDEKKDEIKLDETSLKEAA